MQVQSVLLLVSGLQKSPLLLRKWKMSNRDTFSEKKILNRKYEIKNCELNDTRLGVPGNKRVQAFNAKDPTCINSYCVIKTKDD